MKTIRKFALAAILAISAAAPAFAVDPEMLTLQERDTTLYTPDARPIVQPTHQARQTPRTHRATDAQAYEPAPAAGPDFSLLSQH